MSIDLIAVGAVLAFVFLVMLLLRVIGWACGKSERCKRWVYWDDAKPEHRGGPR